MRRFGTLMIVGMMLVVLSGCGRTPTAPAGSGSKKPAPVHTRSASI